MGVPRAKVSIGRSAAGAGTVKDPLATAVPGADFTVHVAVISG